jgi:alanine racemase
MGTESRRDFFKTTGLASVVFVSGGASTACDGDSERQEESFSVESQIDPWIELDLDNLASNVREVRRIVGTRPIMAVVKCNAYGHGSVEIATALQNHSQVDRFAVVKVREGLALRKNNIQGMILNMGPFNRREARDVIDHNISQSVFSDAVDVLAEEASQLGKRANVHICVDTGMGRVGVPHQVALPFVEKVATMPDIQVEGIFTAMTEDDDFNPTQIRRLESICEAAREKGIDVGVRHAASSAEVDRYPYALLDMVRPGNCLVGLEPERQLNMDIKPVMSFKTRVVYVKSMVAGESLSYHRAYEITKDTRIATLPCGYSDGYPAVVANRADVLIRGRRFRLVGPITANHMTVDVTGSDDVGIGDEVVLWGEQGNERITKVELETLAPEGTNAYRMATRTQPYLPRVTV